MKSIIKRCNIFQRPSVGWRRFFRRDASHNHCRRFSHFFRLPSMDGGSSFFKVTAAFTQLLYQCVKSGHQQRERAADLGHPQFRSATLHTSRRILLDFYGTLSSFFTPLESFNFLFVSSAAREFPFNVEKCMLRLYKN